MNHYTVTYLVFVWASGAMVTTEYSDWRQAVADLTAQWGDDFITITRVADRSF